MCSSLTDDWIQSAEKRYLNAKQLSDKESERDPQTQPYKSKYAAQKILKSLIEELKDLDYDHDHHFKCVNLIEILLNYEIGSIAIDTDETDVGERHLEKALKLIQDHWRDDLSIVLLNIVTLNQLGYLWCCRSDYERACQFLTDAESLYHRWNKAEEQHVITMDFVDVFSLDPIQRAKQMQSHAEKNLEKAHTLTLYFLAQSYEKCGQNSKSAVYCHATLKRQYHGIQSKEQMYDVIEWAINAGTLSQYFAINGDFNAARHHIACAIKVLSTYSGEEEERFKKSDADLHRIIVKYNLMLLESSYDAINSDKPPDRDENNTFQPFLLNEPEVEEIEKQMKTFPILGLDDARDVFKYAMKNLNDAKSYYTLNEHASDYVECIQDQSKLYQFLIPFDPDDDRKCKMFKRRIDLIEDILKELNPEHFQPSCRQLMFESGEVYSQMADVKTRLMFQNEQWTNDERIQRSKKINGLIQKAIYHFDNFVKSFNEKSTNALPLTLSDEYVRPILLSYFSIGRLFSKLITADPRDQLRNWMRCEEYYMKVKDYLKNNPQHEENLHQELPLLDEMIQLIPGKIKLIMNSTMY